ncbi:acetyl/propionyl/methylcrotonyl-CoA carboxylase subunit alpha [Ketobacter sp.]|uniref:acetyl/propionyl/methylcrotonyl-CoA carboxylase subunit alpha n=1 Tax=Ketobacter sp. TaxID=2083498 RepID=UPI000F181939|nr:acetyl/propionyl/methylcrotonyl-CoA carboxylase subunit alpha [Ketobacter sp.]RLT98002.1 MAG: acetyl/propionyl/methylcrotonyl-CoA carboxylase subunit alpha [Ketobacter sp.]
MSRKSLFKKVLIANRGEIACRVIRTLKRLDIETVAVYSDADRQAQHVLLADEAYWIGPSSASESYLNMDRIFEVVEKSGADAIHPGYGFLSENANFARRCAAHDVVLIGPPASAMVAMGSKAQAKLLMAQADVPLVPGYHGENQEPEFLLQQARNIGFPVLLKASLGGGGKGMRLVHAEAEFVESLAACKREAKASFGDDHVLIEKYVMQPRHVEIQVFADTHGNGVYLFERDCSIQRRHQKVVEEAPAPNMDPAIRQAMGEAAVRAAKAIGYVGAGTIEFLLSATGEFYFMEMNTRLQVEHPVTEMITGQDLVEWQVRVAEGLPLPLAQDQLSIEGHAIEVRIYAEDPEHEFLPSTGTIRYLGTPDQTANVRIDSGVVQGDEISVFYDPMIAKLITWDVNRERAIHRMERALTQYHIAGPKTNIGFLQSVIGNAAFQRAELSTHFIDDHHAALAFDSVPATAEDYILAALFLFAQGRGQGSQHEPWNTLTGWQVNSVSSQVFIFQGADSTLQVTLNEDNGSVSAQCGDTRWVVQVNLQGHQMVVSGDYSGRVAAFAQAEQITLFRDGQSVLVEQYRFQHRAADETSDGHLKAPMNGRIVNVAVKPGQAVAEGDLLITVEAMKMEHAIRARCAGVVKAVFFEQGSLVNEGDELIELELDEEE